jgi:hypothetical protein
MNKIPLMIKQLLAQINNVIKMKEDFYETKSRFRCGKNK